LDSPQGQPVVVARPIGAARPDAPWLAAVRPPNPLDLRHLSTGQAWLDVALLLMCTVGVNYLPPLILWLHTGQALPDDGSGGAPPGGLLVLGKWLELTLVASIAAYFVFRTNMPPRGMGLRLDGLGTQLGWSALTLLGAYAYMIGTAIFFIVLVELSGDAQQELQQRAKFMKGLPTSDLATSLLLLIAVGFHEELLFRGLMLPLLKRATSRWWVAVALSSATFGMLHFTQGWVAMIQVTGLGVVLSLFFIRSRSLIAVALAHFAFNFLQFQILNFVQEHGDLLSYVTSSPSG